MLPGSDAEPPAKRRALAKDESTLMACGENRVVSAYFICPLTRTISSIFADPSPVGIATILGSPPLHEVWLYGEDSMYLRRNGSHDMGTFIFGGKQCCGPGVVFGVGENGEAADTPRSQLEVLKAVIKWGEPGHGSFTQWG